MKKIFLSFVFVWGISALFAQTVSPVQSSARPLGLDIISPVYKAGSDATSAGFQANNLPFFNSFRNSSALSSGDPLPGANNVRIDPSSLYVSNDYDMRAYFVSEIADYHNTLGLNATGSGIASGNPEIVFPDTSTRDTAFLGGDEPGDGGRTNWKPLLPGDFVELGTISAGSTLDFFVISDGVQGGTGVISTNPSANTPSYQYVAAFAFTDVNSPYILLAYEDIIGGGDEDFNDLLIAVDFGAANIQAIVTPEPSTFLILGFLCALLLLMRRRKFARS